MRDARMRLQLSDAEVLESFLTLGMTLKIGDLAFTTESLEDYRQARLNEWFDPGRIIVDEPNLLIVDGVRPLPHRSSRKVVVRDFGPTRVVVGAEVRDRNRVRFARALS